MWGSKVGYLTVFVSSRGVQNVEWTVNENKGNRWVNQQLTINLNQLSDRVSKVRIVRLSKVLSDRASKVLSTGMSA